MAETLQLILLYDGLCPLCNAAVRFVLAHDRGGTMRFAPLQGETAREILAQYPTLAGVDSLVLVQAGQGSGVERLWVKSEAVVRCAEYLSGPWRAARVVRVVPRPLRDRAYDLLAGLRHRCFGRYAVCPAPGAAMGARFLP